MTERDLTKLILCCCGTLWRAKKLDLQLRSTSYSADKSIIIYHFFYTKVFGADKHERIELDLPLSILETVNTPEEKLALGQSIISRLWTAYLQNKA